MKKVLRKGLLLACAGLQAHAVEPGEAALTFLSDLRDEARSLEEILGASVLSPHTGEKRRAAISQRLGRVGRYLRDNDYELEVVVEKREGKFAAVVVSAVSRHDPLSIDAFALGLRNMNDSGWGVAPVPGSFDNVDLAYDEVLEKQTDALELWMGAQRLTQFEQMQEKVIASFRRRMRDAVPPEQVEGVSPVQLVHAFASACEEGNLAAAMVFLGQFEGEVTQETRSLQRVIARGLQGLDRRDHWRLLTSPGVVRIAVQEDGADDLDAEVSLLVFDPNRGKPVRLVRFVLLYAGKRWKIELPGSLRMADEDRVTFQRALFQEQDHESDNDLRVSFEKIFEQQHEPLRASSLKEAGRRLGRILREGTLEDFFRFAHRSPELSESERRTAYRYLGEFWSEVHQDSRSAADSELIDVIEHGDAGMLVFHLISTAQVERLNLTPLVLMQDESGWAISPGVTTSGNYTRLQQEKRDRQEELSVLYQEQKEALTRKATEGLLGRFLVAEPDKEKVVDEDAASGLVAEFRSLLREGKLLEAFECGALLDPEEGAWEALKAMSYEYRGARQADTPDHEFHVQSAKGWAAVSLRVDSGLGVVPDFPMYLVVGTKKGPRIVVDVGLRLATNKGREVLNSRVWKRVDEHLEETDSALVRSLFEEHVDRSKSDLAAWQKSNKLSP